MGEITAKTNLSRPAVSHHLRIMKDAGLIKVRKESTMNFYYFDPEMQSLARLAAALQRSPAPCRRSATTRTACRSGF